MKNYIFEGIFGTTLFSTISRTHGVIFILGLCLGFALHKYFLDARNTKK